MPNMAALLSARVIHFGTVCSLVRAEPMARRAMASAMVVAAVVLLASPGNVRAARRPALALARGV